MVPACDVITNGNPSCFHEHRAEIVVVSIVDPLLGLVSEYFDKGAKCYYYITSVFFNILFRRNLRFAAKLSRNCRHFQHARACPTIRTASPSSASLTTVGCPKCIFQIIFWCVYFYIIGSLCNPVHFILYMLSRAPQGLPDCKAVKAQQGSRQHAVEGEACWSPQPGRAGRQPQGSRSPVTQ